MRSHKVVISDEQSGQCNSTFEAFETGSGSGVKFICSVQAFNELLETTIFTAFRVEVFKADNGMLFKLVFGRIFL